MIVKNRKLNRLRNYDYTAPGYYYVTVCTRNRADYFGKIVDENMVLSKFGGIVKNQWIWLSQQYEFVKLDQFVIMPNHFHGILSIALVGNGRDNVGNGRDRSLLQKIKSLSELIGAFKTTSSKLIHNTGLSHFQWQKSFYDRVIRNDADLHRIRQYIVNNPARWDNDRNNIDD